VTRRRKEKSWRLYRSIINNFNMIEYLTCRHYVWTTNANYKCYMKTNWLMCGFSNHEICCLYFLHSTSSFSLSLQIHIYLILQKFLRISSNANSTQYFTKITAISFVRLEQITAQIALSVIINSQNDQFTKRSIFTNT